MLALFAKLFARHFRRLRSSRMLSRYHRDQLKLCGQRFGLWRCGLWFVPLLALVFFAFVACGGEVPVLTSRILENGLQLLEVKSLADIGTIDIYIATNDDLVVQATATGAPAFLGEILLQTMALGS